MWNAEFGIFRIPNSKLHTLMNNFFSGKTCLVTGASGFIGRHVAKLLADEGAHVRVLVRPTSNTKFLDPLGVEKCLGNICDIPSLQKAMESVECLFHIAGLVAFGRNDIAELRRANVQGVRNVLGLAQDLKVKRVILTSSVAAIGGSKDGDVRDETSAWETEAFHNAYAWSKHDGEMEAMKLYQEGLPLVIVNPSFVVGSPDEGPSIGGKFLLAYLQGKMKAYLTMGFNCVDVKDVAKGHLLAAAKGRLGERYILSNENKTLIEYLRLLEKCSGVRAPHLHIPYPVAYGGAALIEGIGRLLRQDFPINREQVRNSRNDSFFSHEKATRELGYHPRPLEETFSEAVKWFREYYTPLTAAL